MPWQPLARFVVCVLTVSSLGAVPQRVAAAEVPFPDMQHSWFQFREAVAFLEDRGAISGYPDGTFKPTETVNRAELLKIIFAARGGPAPSGARDCFSDVKEDQWYAAYVCAAHRRNIVEGYPDGSFKPEQPVNTAEAIKMLLLAYDEEIPELSGEKWYKPYAEELDRTGVYPSHKYLPWAPLTREHTADLVARMLKFSEDRTLPNLSAGCGKAAGRAQTTMTVNGHERSYLLTVPDNYVAHDPAPLIVAFHGRTNSNEQVRAYYGLDKKADGYFVAYPAAIRKENGSFSWANPGDKPGQLRDIAFFDAIVEELAKTYCIDMDRIYTVGHSLGAWMANSVACARGDVVRGSGTVGGDSTVMPCAGPVASFISHNPNDNLASFSSTKRTYENRLKDNACEPVGTPAEPQSLKCQVYSCNGGDPVVWCPHEINTDHRGSYYPHTWPNETASSIVNFFGSLETKVIAGR